MSHPDVAGTAQTTVEAFEDLWEPLGWEEVPPAVASPLPAPMRWANDWDADRYYEAGDAVDVGGVTYLSSVTNRNKPPATEPSFWEAIGGVVPGPGSVSLESFAADVLGEIVATVVLPTFRDDFGGHANGAAPATSDSGHAYQHVGVSTVPTVVAGKLTNAASAGAAASYSNIDMEAKVTRIGGRFTLGASGGSHQGSAVLVIWDRPMGGAVPNSPCHLTIADTTWEYDKWVEGVGATPLASGTFPAPLATDGTGHTAEVFIDGNTATVKLPDGAGGFVWLPPITDPAIGGVGPVAGFEVFQANAATDCKAAWVAVWADTATPDPMLTYPERGELTSTVQSIVQGRLTDPIWIPASRFFVTTGGPVIGAVAAGYTPAMLFDAAAIEACSAVVDVPSYWRTFNLELIWTNAGAGAGSVRWTAGYSKSTDGDAMTVALANQGAATVVAPAQNVQKVTTMLAAIPVDGKRNFAIVILRTGSDAADTLGNDAGVLGLRLTRTS